MTAVERPQRVLLVYAPGPTAQAIDNALCREALDVVSVANVYRAVSSFTLRPADLVVLGVGDLDERDLDVIRALRELRPDVYVLLAFPGGLRDRAVKGLALGADSYILEPFYLGEFLDIVRRGLARVLVAAVPTVESGLGGGDFERLAGAVAHAINNPLQILELELSAGAGTASDTDGFRKEAHRIQAVVEELLAFARRSEIRPESIDVNNLLAGAVPESGEGRNRIRHELADGLPPLSGDRARLKAAFTFLAGLRQARGQDGRLVIRSELIDEERRGGVAVTFLAPELILSPDEKRDLFRPFGGPLQGAVGLAAATARSVLLAHGGEIEVESRHGDGTWVTVRLPAPALNG